MEMNLSINIANKPVSRLGFGTMQLTGDGYPAVIFREH
jgi:aryl-alcohol dehydrogenase-like predicted oxidoreductase